MPTVAPSRSASGAARRRSTTLPTDGRRRRRPSTRSSAPATTRSTGAAPRVTTSSTSRARTQARTSRDITVIDQSQLKGAMQDGNVTGANFTVTLTNQPAVETKISTDAAINVSTVTDGTSTQNEVQQLVVKAARGTYTLSFGGQTTGRPRLQRDRHDDSGGARGLSTIGGGNVGSPRRASAPPSRHLPGNARKQNVANLDATSSVMTPEVQNVDLLDATGGTFTLTPTATRAARSRTTPTLRASRRSSRRSCPPVYVVTGSAGHWVITFQQGAPHVDSPRRRRRRTRERDRARDADDLQLQLDRRRLRHDEPELLPAGGRTAAADRARRPGRRPGPRADRPRRLPDAQDRRARHEQPDVSGGTPYGGSAAPADQAFELDITPKNTLSGVGNSGSFTIAETSGNFTLTLADGGMNATTSRACRRLGRRRRAGGDRRPALRAGRQRHDRDRHPNENAYTYALRVSGLGGHDDRRPERERHR